jgi:hypothetical protein
MRRLYLRMAAKRRRAHITIVININRPATRNIHHICDNKLVVDLVVGSVIIRFTCIAVATVGALCKMEISYVYLLALLSHSTLHVNALGVIINTVVID